MDEKVGQNFEIQKTFVNSFPRKSGPGGLGDELWILGSNI